MAVMTPTVGMAMAMMPKNFNDGFKCTNEWNINATTMMGATSTIGGTAMLGGRAMMSGRATKDCTTMRQWWNLQRKLLPDYYFMKDG